VKDFFKAVAASAIGYLVGTFLLCSFFFVMIAVAVGVLMASHSREKSVTSVEDKSILYVNVEGDIEERKSSVDVVREIVYDEKPKDISLYELNETLKKAAKDKKIKGLLLRLRFASSGWSKVESLRAMILGFKKASGKFVYAYSEGYDEKLYYLATAADEIYLYPKGEFEWDGLSMQSMFFKKALGKLEVEPELIRAGKFKSAGEVLTQEKMSAENRLQMTELSNSLWQTVIKEMVSARKSLNADDLNSWAKNLSVSNAQEALKLKLVDQLLPIEELELKLAAKTQVKKDEEPRLIAWNSYYDLSSKPSFIGKKDKIAVIMAEGEIESGDGPSNDKIYSDELAGLIRDLNRDDDIKAVVLRVNSPGGSALASDVIWRSLEYLKKKKKLVASFSDVAASGGYYIAAGADYIYAEPTTITGSIGVFGVLFNTEKFFDHKLGITFDVVKTHDSADMSSGQRALTPYEKGKVQEQVNYTYHSFLGVVKEGRKKFEDVEAVNEIAQGRVWAGAMAKDIGLVDEMGSLDQAIAKAASLAKLKNYEVVLYPDEKKFLDKIFDSLGDVFTLPVWLTRVFSKTPKQDMVYARLPFLLEM